MVFKASFNNISIISWRSVLLVDETGVPVENNGQEPNCREYVFLEPENYFHAKRKSYYYFYFGHQKSVMFFFQEEFEDSKEVIRISILKKNRQHNGQKKGQTTIYKTYT